MKRIWNFTACIIILVFLFLGFNNDASAREPFFRLTDVFVGGREGYHDYGIPSIIVTPKGTVLAFCEAHQFGGDSGNVDIVLKRSFDNGKTWGSLKIVWDDGENPRTIVDRSTGDIFHGGGNTCGNPCAVVDRDTGTVWLLLTHNLGQDIVEQILKETSEGTRTVWVTKSIDEGATWSEPVEITENVKAPNWTWYATGPGIGIQLKSGRLIIPCDHVEAKTIQSGAHIIYSDDHGETWHLGGSANCGEPQVVELVDGTLLVNIRHGDTRLFYVMPFPTLNHRPLYRLIATSKNGGLTLSDTYIDSTLIETENGCQASIIRFTDEISHDKNRILFSNPASQKARENLTVRLSYDEGKTWPISKLIHPLQSGSTAYSCLTVFKNGNIGCLYNGATESGAGKITLAIFNLEWLTDGADGLPE